MKLYVGLGNPGKEYEKTRHNVGFCVMDCFANKTGLIFDQKKFNALYGKIKINGEDVIAVKPLTYMNLSGEAVREIANFYKIETNDIVIIHDDIDLPLGKLRLRYNGSGGGHNGMKNIVLNMSTQEIKRIRVGVSNNKLIDQKDYVLGKFSKEEQKIMKEAFDKAADALIDYTKVTFDQLMNKYNSIDK